MNAPGPRAERPARAQWQTFHDAILLVINARLTAIAGLAALEREHAADAWATDEQRARWAQAGDEAGLHWNATTIVYLVGVIEGHISAMLPVLYDTASESQARRRKAFISSLRDHDRNLRSDGTHPDKIRALRALSVQLIDAFMPPPVKSIPRQQLVGDRWERALRGIFFGPPPGRPLPEDLRKTLNEIGEVRNVLLHHLGFVDERVLSANFEGPWLAAGERVVITIGLYRRYVAALYAYSEEMKDRFLLRLGGTPIADITRWREAVPVGG